MARLTKFASVNLNESYGKPEQAGSTGAGANSSGSGKSRLPTQGGMLVLTRPGRAQPAGLKPGRLGIPSPVNLPSMKREHSGGDTPVSVATSPPLPGWTKSSQQQAENLTSSTGIMTAAMAETPGSGRAGVITGGARAGSLEIVTEDLRSVPPPPPAAVGKADVYAPPGLRAMQAGGGLTPRRLPTTAADKAVVIRGEEFPTLQASLVRPPTPPQQHRQKEIQQKQREKQQEIKEQQVKLQQLSQQQQAQAQKQSFRDSSLAGAGAGAGAVGLQLQPAQPMRPQMKQEQEVAADVKQLGTPTDRTVGQARYGDGTLSRAPPLVKLNHVSNWADDERERGQNLRPQGGSPIPVDQESSCIDTRQSGYNSEIEQSWPPMRRDLLPSRNGDISRNVKDFRAGSDEDSGGSGVTVSRDGNDLKGSSFGREGNFGRDQPQGKDGFAAGFGRGDFGYPRQEGFGKDVSSPSRGDFGYPRQEGFGKDMSSPSRGDFGYPRQEGFGKDVSSPSSFVRGAVPMREAGQGREGFHGRGWFGRDAYNRDFREAYNRDAREAYNQDVNLSRQGGYGNFSGDGGNSRRGDISDTGYPHGRANFFAAGGPVSPNTGSGHDTRFSRRYGFHSTGGDNFFAKNEARPGLDARTPRGRYAEPSIASPAAEGSGFRRTRGHALGGNSRDTEREFFEAELERTQNLLEEERQKRDHALEGNSLDTERESFEAELERTQNLLEEERQKKSEEKERGVNLTKEEEDGLEYVPPGTFHKVDENREFAARAEQADASHKLEEERRSREEERKQLLLEEERRKEAAKRKLIELEERIAQREAEEKRRQEAEQKGKIEDDKLYEVTDVNFKASRQDDSEGAIPNMELEEEEKGNLFGGITGIGWKGDDFPPKPARPSSASSSSSLTLASKVPAEELSQETAPQDIGLGVPETKFNQEPKATRSKSPISWRKESNSNGNGPKSRLFSSPYIESGGFHRPTDGGNYKLF